MDPGFPRAIPGISWVGDRFLRVSLGGEVSLDTQRRVHAACRRLRDAAIPGLLDVVPAYATVLLSFDGAGLEACAAERAVCSALRGLGDEADDPPAAARAVPVCYEPEHGPDLDEVAALNGLSRDEAEALHCGAEYTVGFMGFTPGFAYLHGLPAGLASARLESPRARVAAGSVGIAGVQTGIYPGGTPGGWRLIGRTPLRVFDTGREVPALLGVGERVRFVPITAAEFDALAAEPARWRG
jgi:KipI family sensor histidine kinase inhibitor